MPRAEPLPNFCAPDYVTRSVQESANKTLNYYYESVEVPGSDKTHWALYQRLGSAAFGTSTILGQPRGLLQFDGNGVPDGAIFGVTATTLWQGSPVGVQSAFATAVVNDGKMAHLAANAASVGQIFVTSGGHGYCLNSGTLTEITIGADFFGARDVTFIDGYFVVLSDTTNRQQFQISAINNGLSWSGADVGLLLGQADPIQRVIANLEFLYFIGTRRGEIWYNSGNNLFPFTIESGAFLEVGTNAPDSVCQAKTGSGSTSVYWLGQDARGSNMAMRVNGLASERISDHAWEFEVSLYSTTSDCICYSYQFFGHSMVRFIFPTVNKGWDYDITESAKNGFPVWNRVSFTNLSGTQLAPLERVGCYAFGKTIIASGGADSRAGQLYQSDPRVFGAAIYDAYEYGPFPITKQRIYRLPFNGGMRTILDRIEFLCEPGTGNAFVTDPVFKLAFSRDGGVTYGSDISIPIGEAGQTRLKVALNRCGYYADGAIRLTCSDPVNAALFGANIYSRPGVS